jgi:hypothetical protein
MRKLFFKRHPWAHKEEKERGGEIGRERSKEKSR